MIQPISSKSSPLKLIRNCNFCGSESIINSENRHIQCKSCGEEFFINIAAAAGVLILQGSDLLYTLRSRNPGVGKLDFPGGFLDPGEAAEEGVFREVREELGIIPIGLKYLGSFPNQYLYRGVLYHTCDIFFTAQGYMGALNANRDEILSVHTENISNINPEDFAFSSHASALRRLRAHIENEPSPGV